MCDVRRVLFADGLVEALSIALLTSTPCVVDFNACILDGSVLNKFGVHASLRLEKSLDSKLGLLVDEDLRALPIRFVQVILSCNGLMTNRLFSMKSPPTAKDLMKS